MELEKEGPQSGPYVLGDGGEAATKSARGTRPPMITDLMQGKHPLHSSSGGYSNSQRYQIFAGGWNGNREIISAGRKNCGISSDGCGMDQKTVARIFDKLFQGDTSHAAEGFGLSLPMVKKIVELHHGRLTVESSVGQGTTFIIELPVK